MSPPRPADAAPHAPVLLAEVVAAIAPRDGGVYVDGTFGAGGYSAALLAAARCRVCAIDRDPAAIAEGARLESRHGGRLTLVDGRFGDMRALLAARGIDAVDGVTLDLGVSSMQIDQAERGFSFRLDGPLDMRMGDTGPTAADLVNTLGESDLADLIHRYGEERAARRIARALCAARAEAPIETTGRLAGIVRRAAGRPGDRIDAATRAFQALRIAVNDELGELERGLGGAESLLAPGGRLAVVSFHSLEDRAVKTFLGLRSGGGGRPSRHAPPAVENRPEPTFRLPGRGATKPSAAEIDRNPRARSARLRTAERTAAPPWPDRRAA